MLDDAWLRSGGADGPLGAPVGAVADIGSGNLRRGFERGEMAWSAGQEMVVTAYRLHDYVRFDWSLAPGSLLHYEFWQFEVFRDGAGQGFSNATLSGLPERSGRLQMRIARFGRYDFEVRGCDDPGAGTCRQGWTTRSVSTPGRESSRLRRICRSAG